MKQIAAILIALLFWQCQDIKYPEAPENLIDKQTMIQIYTDAYLANASKNFNRTILLREQIALSEYIYKKYDIDSVQYEKSNAYYSINLDEYKEMFLQVQANIDARFDVVDSIVKVQEETERLRKDSIRKARQMHRDSLGYGAEDSLDPDFQRLLDEPELDTIKRPAIKTIRGEVLPEGLKDSIH